MPADPATEQDPFPYYRGSAAEYTGDSAQAQLPDWATVPYNLAPVGPEALQLGLGPSSSPLVPGGQQAQSTQSAQNSDVGKLLASFGTRTAASGGGGVQGIVGDTAAGAGIGFEAGGPVGAAIGGGIGLVGGVLGDVFGGGPSEEEQVQLDTAKLALQELQRRVAARNKMVDYFNNPTTQANMAAPAERLQATNQYPADYHTPMAPPPALPPPQTAPPTPSQAVPGYEGPTSYPLPPEDPRNPRARGY